MPPSTQAAFNFFFLAVAVITPPQEVDFWSLLLSQSTKAFSCMASSICVRNSISPEIKVLGALLTVKAKPATVWYSCKGTILFGNAWSISTNSRSTSLMAPVYKSSYRASNSSSGIGKVTCSAPSLALMSLSSFIMLTSFLYCSTLMVIFFLKIIFIHLNLPKSHRPQEQ